MTSKKAIEKLGSEQLQFDQLAASLKQETKLVVFLKFFYEYQTMEESQDLPFGKNLFFLT